MTAEAHQHFLPAMGAHGPLALYDPFTRLLGARRLQERLIDQARIRPDDRVLDIGCGTGNLTLLVAKRYPTASVVGLDPDPAALDRARKKAAKGKLTAAFDQGFAEELPYPDRSVDVVLCSLALHHVTEEHRITVAARGCPGAAPGRHLSSAGDGQGRSRAAGQPVGPPLATRHTPGANWTLSR